MLPPRMREIQAIPGLPFRETGLHALDTNGSTQASAPRATVLIVDDDTGVLGSLLQPHHDGLAAPTGERALQIAASVPKPDLIGLSVGQAHRTADQVRPAGAGRKAVYFPVQDVRMSR